MVGSVLGHPVLRVEDPQFLTGSARYMDDVDHPGVLHSAFARAVLPHAHITGIDSLAAESSPGVHGVFTAESLPLRPIASDRVSDVFARPPLASGKVRFIGEPIALIVAESRTAALDAAPKVIVDYDPLEPVIDPLEALEEAAPLLFPEYGSNVAQSDDFGTPPVSFAEADSIVSARFVNQRLAPVPIETNGCLMVPGADETITAYLPVQAANWAREDLASSLGMEESQVRVICPAIGGGFGAKIPIYPEQVAVAAVALQIGRAVKYIESRSENMVAMTHGRAQVQDVKIGARSDGRIVALHADLVSDAGAYPGESGELVELTRDMASGVYDIPNISATANYVATNTTPTFAYRGAGRPEATAMIERALDMLAAKLNLDPAEIRRRNFIAPGSFPHRTPTGQTYDSGEYEKTLATALEMAGYEDLRADQAARREEGDRRQLGIGICSYVEITGWGKEFGRVRIGRDGAATVYTGTTSTGQGHETAWAQIVGATLGVPLAEIKVVHSDTDEIPWGEGTMGSRSLQIGGSAIANAAEIVLEKAKEAAAEALEVSTADVVVADGRGLQVAGVPDSRMSWADLAAQVDLDAEVDFKPDGNTYPFGTHVAVVEVDVETGAPRLLRHVAVDDCGTIINPILVEGQVHGGVAQGVAQALFEHLSYDEDGNPLTASLLNYGVPSAAELPPFETVRTQTPTPVNPLGAKGIGESGTIGSTAAVMNAVIDAVSHLGVRHIDMPLTPERIWRAIKAAEG
jgi:aerobic carbon-monoxide dehydrogenase large subunit